jgi:acyl-CoA thioesterase
MRFDPPGPLATLLGIRPEVFGEGRARFALTLRDDHLNPYGVVHGGVVYSLADTAMGGALVTRLEPGERCATVEIKINYLAAATEGALAAEAVVVERTKRIGVIEARVFGDGDRLVALATGTFYIQSAGA